jgi:hypothetical protein
MSDRTHSTRRFAALGLAAAIALAAAPAAGAADPATPKPEAASATLPLEQILELYRERDEARREKPPAPPLAAALQKLELSGRLLDDGIDFTGRFEVSVLSDDDWVRVPLLALDAHSHLSDLPAVNGGAFAVEDGRLLFLTRKRGRYAFEVSLFRSASAEGRLRRLALGHGGAALAVCRLEIDGGLFRLHNTHVAEARNGVRIFPSGDRFEIEWEVLEGVEPAAATAVKPAIESVAPRVHASAVSTLEGRRIIRVLYELRFAGRKPIEISLPAGQRLERAFLNGVAVPAEPADGRLALELSPARAGDEGGTLELVLVQEGGVFHLAGDLRFELPRVSWPTHELFLTLHLPRVFDYAWTGGSLEPGGACPAVSYSYRLPQPGTALHFHQVLIAESAPDLALDYAVNLDGHYFVDSRRTD